MEHKKVVAYFDFDGTLTTKDTLLPFLLYVTGNFRFFLLYFFRLIPNVILYLIKIIDNEEFKQRTLQLILRGKTHEFLQHKAVTFTHKHLKKYIKPDVYAKLEWHREHGHKIYIVSANLALYLNYWAKIHQLDGVIATELEFINGICTGKLSTRNCYGPQKVIRISQYNQENNVFLDYSYGYGNSRGDKEMLIMVNEPYYVAGNVITKIEKYA